MGLISALFWYRVGKRKGRSQDIEDSYGDYANDYEDVCTNCGYRESQHSDEGDCPTY